MRSVLLVTVLALFGACGSQQEPSPAPSEPRAPDPAPVQEPQVADPPPSSETAPRIVVGTDTCTTDSDCVPDGCCHPAACVSASHAPSCGDMVCTTECRYGT